MKRTIIIAAVAGILGIGIGAASAAPDADPEPSATAIATTAPTPEPVAQPTPQVVEVEVEVTPEACLDAIDWMLGDGAASYELIAGILADYVDFPDEDLTQFGRRVEDRLGTYTVDTAGFDRALVDVGECRASAR